MNIQQDSPSSSETAASAESDAATHAHPIKVWLVDDDDRIRSIVAECLGRSGGIVCTRDFNSPNAVLSALASKPGPDVILLDVQMGELSGLDAVRPIRSLSRSTRVVMFTSSYDHHRQQRALADGASDFLLKYNPMENLVTRIRELAREPAPKVTRRRASGSGCVSTHRSSERRRSWVGSHRSDTAPVESHRTPSARPRGLGRYLDLLRGFRA